MILRPFYTFYLIQLTRKSANFFVFIVYWRLFLTRVYAPLNDEVILSLNVKVTGNENVKIVFRAYLHEKWTDLLQMKTIIILKPFHRFLTISSLVNGRSTSSGTQAILHVLTR